MQPVPHPLGMPVIRAVGLHKDYGLQASVPALANVDLIVDFNEIVALRGPSGSGKSTLLNILGCLDRPTRGSYLLGGCDVSSLNREEQAWVRLNYIGFIFQFFHLLSHATALENVALPLYYAGISRKESDRIATERLARVGLAARANHFPTQLSGGERQRVAIARALTRSPRLLLADEPTGALDTRTGNEIMRLLVELHREEGTAIVLVTHDPRVASFANRQVFLMDGRIVSEQEVESGIRH